MYHLRSRAFARMASHGLPSLLALLLTLHSGARSAWSNPYIHFVVGPGRHIMAVLEFTDCEGQTVEERQELPPGVFQESSPFATREHAGGSVDREYRVIYRCDEHDYIAGLAVRTEEAGDDRGATHVEWTNLMKDEDLGYDPATRQVWFRPDVTRLPPEPRPFDDTSWTGRRFWIARTLWKKSPRRARDLVLKNGGILVDRAGPVDVVVLPDSFDFTRGPGARDPGAEAWIARGARLISESDFWPGPFERAD